MTVRLPTRAREWQLVRRPEGRAVAGDFALVEVDVPKPSPGQVVIRNTHLSVDPYMRGRMDDKPSYIDPFPLHAALEGAAIGVVVESRAGGFAAGDVVEHFFGLRDVTVTEASNIAQVDLDGLPAEAFLGVMGGPGLTAWLGVVDVAAVRAGDVVLVTGAAGAVGSLAAQVARLRGASHVIGSAGTAEKVRHLREDLGLDSAFDYHDGDFGQQLASAAPEGIDVLFDNVGGSQLEAAIDNVRIGGRLALCGMASQYDGQAASGPRNLFELISKRVTARGFIVSDHLDRMEAFRADVGSWVRDGKIVHRESVVDGLEQVPAVLQDLLRSGAPAMGKRVVRLDEVA